MDHQQDLLSGDTLEDILLMDKMDTEAKVDSLIRVRDSLVRCLVNKERGPLPQLMSLLLRAKIMLMRT